MTDEGRAESAERIGKQTEPCWDSFMPLLTAGFCPAKTARRTDHLKWGGAIGTHLTSLFFIVGIVFCVTVSGGDMLPDAFSPLLLAFVGLLVLSAVVGLGCLLPALLLTPWGARQERIRTSLGRSLHRALRHTPHIMQALLLASLIGTPLSRASSDSCRTRMNEVNVARDNLIAEGVKPHMAYARAVEIVQSRYPFYVIYGDELCLAVYCIGGLWFVWGLLAAIGATAAKIELETHPPSCEACGYNLTSLPVEGNCPECGDPIASSLGPDARLGTPWQRRSVFNRWSGLCKTTKAAFTCPTSLGRVLIPSPDGADHRSLVWVWWGLVFVVAWLGCLLCRYLDPSYASSYSGPAFFWLFCPATAYGYAMAAVLVQIAAAGVVGLLSSAKHNRNMFPAATQAACAAGGVLPVWLVLALVGWAIAIVVGQHPANQGTLVAPSPDPLVVILHAGPSVVCALIYLWIVARIARGARFANG